jgi:hypothetical protein
VQLYCREQRGGRKLVKVCGCQNGLSLLSMCLIIVVSNAAVEKCMWKVGDGLDNVKL